MKQKKLTYLLLLAVIAVWGIIIYRIVLSQGAEDSGPAGFGDSIRKNELPEDIGMPDTFKLTLNYRDPFLGTTVPQMDTANVLPAGKTIPEPPPVKPVIDWSFIHYSGFVINPETKRLVSMVNINNKNRMMTEGETFEGVKLLKSFRDSLLVKYQDQVKNIVLR